MTAAGQSHGVRPAGAAARPVEDSGVPAAPIAFLVAVLAAAVLAFTMIVTADPAPVSAGLGPQGPPNPAAGADAEEEDGDGKGDGNGEGDGDGNGDGDGDGGGNGNGDGDGDGDGDAGDGDSGEGDDEASGSFDAGDNSDSGGGDGIEPDRGFAGDRSSDELAKWDDDSGAYTVVIGSATTKDEAKDRAEDAAKAGLPAGVLEAEDYAGLEGDGPWVVFAGRFESERDARESQSAFSSKGFPGHVRSVTPTDAGRDSEKASTEDADEASTDSDEDEGEESEEDEPEDDSKGKSDGEDD